MTAHVTQMKTAAEAALASEYAASRSSLPGTPEVAALRDASFATIAAGGLPHRRIEHWHYTDLRAQMREAKPLAPRPDAKAIVAARETLARHTDADRTKLVLLDGSFIVELSDLDALPAGVQVMPMARALAEGRADIIARLGTLAVAKGDHALALNASFMRDGVVIVVADGNEVSQPLHLVNLRSDASTASFARSLVLVGQDATLTIVETYGQSVSGSGGKIDDRQSNDCQINDALEFVLAKGAKLEHVLLQDLAPQTLQLTTLTADLDEGSRFDSVALVLGAGLSRRQLYVRFSGENVKAGLRGASLLKGHQHADTTLIMDHAVPNGESRELFKHVLDGAATGVFQGKVIVRPQAQKTDGGMRSNALLLSDDATMNNKPELEIFADDVVCGHGATVGALDEDLLFYLMARGLPKIEAERLLIQAFVGEAIEFVSIEPLREALNAHVDEWLSAR